MASRPFPNLTPGFGRNALDLPVAALAAVAVAFAAFAMPGDLMARLVEGSGLPSLLSAAEPPLGMKARIGVGLIGAVGAFGLVFILLRLLDRTGLESRRAASELELEQEAPRPRRRDFHPDAPAPRPISALRDLGEPAPPQPPISSLWPEAPAQAGWEAAAEIEPEPERALEPVSEPEPEPLVLSAPEPEPAPPPAEGESLAALMARLEQGLARRAQLAPEPEPASEPVPAPPPALPEAGNDRLQNAIESLQRFAARD
jgi:hypothetical protein